MTLFLHKYPYTDMHEMNLDWLLDVVSKNKLNIESLMDSVEDVIDLIGDSPLQTVAQTITAAINELKNGKQDKLTAGANVNISDDNVISATDTKYTAGANVSISANNEISATGELSLDIATVTGELTLPATTPYRATTNINYPEGYTKNNCIPIAVAKMQTDNVYWTFGDTTGNQDSLGYVKGAFRTLVTLHDDHITVQAQSFDADAEISGENEVPMTFKVYLLKI